MVWGLFRSGQALTCERLRDFETELLYAIPYLVAIETEQLCSMALIPVTALERLHQKLPLDLLHVHAFGRQPELRRYRRRAGEYQVIGFDIPTAPATSHSGDRVPLVVVASGNTRAAIAVDELLAEEEILVKNLGARLRRVHHFTGATILLSGRVALILNTADVLRSALQRAPSKSLRTALTKDRTERRQRILLAEDSLTTRSLEKSILESAGYDVVAAADGSDAWRILQERGADLVVADVEMPRMDGFALCEAIRRSPRFGELPIVLVTALESATDKARGLEIGADAYLPKSAFDQRQLLDTIAQLL